MESWEAEFAWNADWRVTSWDEGTERLLGWTAAEALGRPVFEVAPGDGDRFARMSALRQGGWGGILVVAAKDGHHVAVEAEATAERDAAGEITGWRSRLRELPPSEAYRAATERL